MIYILTHSFPYARRGEVFLRDEMRVLADLKKLDNVRFVPLRKEPGVGENGPTAVDSVLFAQSEPCLLNVGLGHKVSLLFTMVLQARFWKMPLDFNRKMPFFTCLKQGIKYFYAAWVYADWFRENRHKFKADDVIYSYWAHYNVLGMAIARQKGWLPKGGRCYSRGHRYDVYEEDSGRYFPYRRFSLSVLDGLFPCSQNGTDFLCQRYPEIEKKIKTAYLGVLPVGQDDKQRFSALTPPTHVYRVVSCALVSPVKRLDLLLGSLAAFSQQIPESKILEWHHFGGGAALKTLQAEAERLSASAPRLRVVWHGNVENAVIREAYLSNYFHAFINVSSSEGLPVSFMEAFSAGIPVLATDVGGSGELVKGGAGALLPKNFTQEDFNTALWQLLQTDSLARGSARACYEAHFSAEDNYAAFYRDFIA